MKSILAVLALTLSLTSCGTYHKVAVWYKYRKDFHLPKSATAAQPVQVLHDTASIAQAGLPPTALSLANAPSGTRKTVRRIKPDPPALAAIHAHTELAPRRPVWEPRFGEPAQDAPAPPKKAPFHWTTIFGFVCTMLGIAAGVLGFVNLAFLWGLFLLVPGMYSSIVGYLYIVSPEVFKHRALYRGLGFALPGCILALLIATAAVVASFVYMIVLAMEMLR